MKNLKTILRITALLSLLFVKSGNCTDITAAGSGNWNSTSTWVGNTVPGAGDNVTIPNGFTIALTADAACNNLTLQTISVNNIAIGNYVLQVSGTLNGPNTNFTNPIITTGTGRLSFIGTGRALFGTQWAASHPDWRCEIALNAGETGTASTNVKFGYLIITSGTFQVGTASATKDLRIDGTGNNTGTISIASGATLIVTGICGARSSTATTYCGAVDVNGTLIVQGSRLNGVISINNGGKIVIKKISTTALISSAIATPNFTYASGSSLQYDLEGSVGRISTGAEISQATNTRSLYNLIINNSNGIDLQSSLSVTGTLKFISGNITTSSAISYGTNATVYYNGSASQTTANLEFPAVNGPSNIVIDNASGVLLHADRTISGTLYLTNGAFSIGANSLTINGAINTTSGSLTGGSSSNLNIGGSGASTTLPSVTLNNLTVDRPNGINLGGNVSLTGTLTMTSGNITTGANILSIGTSTSSPGALSFTSGAIIGNCKRWVGASNQAGLLFPFGNVQTLPSPGTYGKSVTVGFTASPSTYGSLTAKFVASDPGTVSTSSFTDGGYTIDRYCDEGYWQVDATDALAGGTYDIDITGSGFISVGSYADIHLMKRTNGTTPWAVSGTHNAGTGSNSNPVAHRTGLTTFSQFAYGSNSANNQFNGPLPVELTIFNTTVNGNTAKLSWVTGSEINNYGFDVERKVLNGVWSKVGFVRGNGNNASSYSYEDRNLQTGKYSYRLKQIDVNGNYEYHNHNGEVEIGVPGKFRLSQNYPNPFNQTTIINFQCSVSGNVKIVIYDMTGRAVKTLLNDFRQAGYYIYHFNAGSLSSGVYLYRIEAGSFSKALKMVVLK